MEFFRIKRDIPFMRHALVFNVISFVTFAAAVFFLVTRGLHFSIEFTGSTVIEVAYTVLNRAADAPASLVAFYLSADDALDPADTLLATVPVPALGWREAHAATVQLTVPADAVGGARYLLARADAGDAIEELDETNNVRARPILIGPDLVVWLDLPGNATPSGANSSLPLSEIVHC